MFAEEGVTAGSDVSIDTSADGSTSTDTSVDEGQLANDTTDANASNIDRDAEFDNLIKNEYAEQYNARFQQGLSKRMKSSNNKIKAFESQIQKINPVMQKLAVKYGIDDPNNLDAIVSAVDADNTYYEQYAFEHNVTNEQARSLVEAERITKANAERIAFDKKFSDWMNQANELKNKYPDFDFNAESQDEEFRRLLDVGISVEDAYTLKHRDEIIGGAMQYTYNQAQQDFANNQRTMKSRPKENGMSGQQASQVKTDINNLNALQTAKLVSAIKRGEEVTPDNFEKFL